LAKLGADVTGVDKATLHSAVAAMPGTERLGSGFGLSPEPVDWLFCDMIAYPGRLLALVHRWIDAGRRAIHRLHDQVPGADRP
jgi:23S rRNA (cytidine2498-2'-O)-methyltransferase